jgi:O-antigen ligase
MAEKLSVIRYRLKVNSCCLFSGVFSFGIQLVWRTVCTMLRNAQKKIARLMPWLMVATFAVLPFSAKAANVTALLELVLWLLEGGLKEKWAAIRSNPVAWLPLLYFLFLCIGLLWTSDLDWGLHIIKKARRFLFIPVFISVAAKHPKAFRFGVYGFIASTAVTAVVSLGVASGLIPIFGKATTESPSPFVYHTSYAPQLAWATYLSLALMLFDTTISRGFEKSLFGVGGVILLALFMNIGVAGYAAALMLLGLLVLQWKKNILLPALAVVLLAGSAYWFSPSVHRRVDQNIQEVINVFEGTASQEDVTEGAVENTSLGPRMVFWGNTWQLIKQHPLLGVGTGDFPTEYEKVRAERTPNHWEEVNNPHNMYLMVWAQSGLVGLLIFLGIFAALFARSLRQTGLEAKLTTGLICFMLLIMLSDAYMQLNNTSLLFALFASASAVRGFKKV